MLLLAFMITAPLSSGWTQTTAQVKYKCTLCGQTFDQDMTGKKPCPRNANTTNSGHACSKVN
ncbi:MAG: hypothetical protein EBT57_07645 [Verrucomicrobia bacterium]|nr:hypothetical protein [Verrucomicrobiota bacterium]